MSLSLSLYDCKFFCWSFYIHLSVSGTLALFDPPAQRNKGEAAPIGDLRQQAGPPTQYVGVAASQTNSDKEELVLLSDSKWSPCAPFGRLRP